MQLIVFTLLLVLYLPSYSAQTPTATPVANAPTVAIPAAPLPANLSQECQAAVNKQSNNTALQRALQEYTSEVQQCTQDTLQK